MLKIAKGRISYLAVLGAVLFMIVQVIANLNLPSLTSDIVNNGVAKGDINYIWKIGFEMAGFSLISILAAICNVFLAARTSQKLGQNLRSDVYRKVINFSKDEYDQIETSSLITRTTNDVVQIQNVAIIMLRMMLMAPIMLIGASFLAYTKDHQLTMIFLVVLPIMIIFVGLLLYFSVPLFRAMQTKTDKINRIFREGLTGVRVIRAFRQDQFEQDRFEDANKDYTANAIKVNTIVALAFPVMTLIMSGTNVAIVWFGAKLIGAQSMQVGNLIAFMSYAMQILMSFMMLSMVFVFIPRAQASAKRIQTVFALKSTMKPAEHPVALDPNVKQHTLSFDHVDYRYRQAEMPALSDIDFKASSGQTVAIIGGTGSGKTTLVSLIPRFYDVDKGEIELDGHNINDFSMKDLRNQVSFVPQKATLFTGSIRDNMKYGNPNATDDEIWHALEIARAKDFVEEDPAGLDLQVEQGGDNFSGGQKQRLAIARALVKKSAVYVFDDSFSALDFKTDADLRAALRADEHIQQSITVIVAQRIATVADADLILVLDNGKLVGKGTHDELRANNKVYQEIIHSQLREEDDK
ncbi:putative multidrug export ATP-binding/permease protein [Lentilactobacillus parabuchneri]|jgi:ATP-binding cassette subfamily B protein|uniref:Xenobiotic-transporting ATPase n=5 Tax=Lentilactobacillus parabuchneri TaxID=152331 RepID=A0A0R1YWB8_9LACO|nr:ABC transporter ATP-binding protein [Lentilactobacillus parabuchneri]APR07541.1 Putative multidrug export ATP-binding/permease protein [Lentilactobacillus parabuchneri]KRM46261.1 xenobiotic-transporting ATPase [Lentilactobacillus parabuchneri DSM 5707 = NBRC 107865]KRN72913.1 xenobiotic-transporting ATPase [Lentilactobacillus parabuchneri]MBW0222980.1 ABC transporter ATP-binding protein/permease [Lentilactobacillus parabuchneri]MBW0245916.1 ABC transporter ATP-binding protein/permease [Lent